MAFFTSMVERMNNCLLNISLLSWCALKLMMILLPRLSVVILSYKLTICSSKFDAFTYGCLIIRPSIPPIKWDGVGAGSRGNDYYMYVTASVPDPKMNVHERNIKTNHRKIFWLLIFLQSSIPFTPEFLNWSIPSLHLSCTFLQTGHRQIFKHLIANGVDPDKTTRYEASYLDIHPDQKE